MRKPRIRHYRITFTETVQYIVEFTSDKILDAEEPEWFEIMYTAKPNWTVGIETGTEVLERNLDKLEMLVE